MKAMDPILQAQARRLSAISKWYSQNDNKLGMSLISWENNTINHEIFIFIICIVILYIYNVTFVIISTNHLLIIEDTDFINLLIVYITTYFFLVSVDIALIIGTDDSRCCKHLKAVVWGSSINKPYNVWTR